MAFIEPFMSNAFFKISMGLNITLACIYWITFEQMKLRSMRTKILITGHKQLFLVHTNNSVSGH